MVLGLRLRSHASVASILPTSHPLNFSAFPCSSHIIQRHQARVQCKKHHHANQTWASASQRLKDFIKWAVGTGRAHPFEADVFQLNYKRVSLCSSVCMESVQTFKVSFPSIFITILSVLVTHQVLSLRQCPPWPPGVGTAAAVSSGAWQWHTGTRVPEIACTICVSRHSFTHEFRPRPFHSNSHTFGKKYPHSWIRLTGCFYFFASLKSSFLPAVCALFIY